MSRPPLPSMVASALDPAHSVVVEACAGSGKTWLLVSRILRLLLAGVPANEILAITFTRQAAQEMAERLRQWLRVLAVDSDAAAAQFLRARAVPEEEIEAALGRARGLYEQVLNAQPALTITTFHSWFLQVLRKAPLEAGAVGNVSLLERTSALLEEAWSLFIEDCGRQRESPAARALDFLFARYGLYSTRCLLHSFIRNRAEWWAYAGTGADAIEQALAQQSRPLGGKQASASTALFHDAGFVADLREVLDLFARNTALEVASAQALVLALEEQRYDAALAALERALFTDKSQPRVRKPSAKQAQRLGVAGEARYLQLCSSLTEAVRAAVQDAADEASYRANAAGLVAGSALLAHYQQLKQDRQAVDFSDVEWLAYELLVRRQQAVTLHFKLDSRYRHILLDEFQDTNPLQWRALEAWFDAAVQADSSPVVFLVGDPKQAIFRFRRADARLFEAARDWLETQRGAAVHEQHESRRCAQPVLDVVNRLFQAEPGFEPYDSHRSHQPALTGRVEVLPLAGNDTSVAAPVLPGLRDPFRLPRPVEEDNRREREARQLVARLSEIVGRWRIADESAPGGSRAARYADIMVLVRRRTHLQIYERALLHAGMPFVTSRQGGLLDTLEAEDLMALLEFLVSPFDDLKLAHALRSPIFELSDPALLEIAQAPGDSWWQRLQALANGSAVHGIARAHALLARWLDFADRLPVHDVLDRIYFEGDVQHRYQAAVPEAMRAAVGANLNAFIQRALEVDSGRYPSLPRFLSELRDMAKAPSEEAPDEGEALYSSDVVRIRTVHGAKGLEAPVVWLLDAAASSPPERGFDALVQWEPGEEAPRSFSLRTSSRESSRAQRALLETEARYQQREELNLLYVAMTRAKQGLIVSGCDTRSLAGSWYARVRTAVLTAAGREEEPEAPAVHGNDLGEGATMLPTAPQPPAGSAQRKKQGDGSGGGQTLQAQLVLDFDADARSRPAQIGPVGRRTERYATPALRYGTAFHALMQHAFAGARFDPSHWGLRLGLPAPQVAPLCQQAESLMADASLVRFFDPACFLRALNEWPIATGTGALQRVDRMVEFSDEVWVLDYKTGGLSSVAGTALEAEYRAQVAGYLATLSAVFSSKRARGLLLFADGSRVEIEGVPA